MPASQAGNAESCRLGRTLRRLDAGFDQDAYYRESDRQHRAFHAVTAVLASGEPLDMQVLEDWRRLSRSLSTTLERWALRLEKAAHPGDTRG
ncbi:MAG: hypothetical protein OWU84_15560 [Firmicutes bacterium]|nr:hypothetical protein [Bacillota bacterium]